jgi:peptidyl-tRNA hydrolase
MQDKARSKGIVAESIRDAGRTQVAAGTRTVLAIGPGTCMFLAFSWLSTTFSLICSFFLLDYVSKVNEITGHLKLY